MSKADTGCKIPCFNCNTTFSSKGLRCCSLACEREYSRDFPHTTAFTAVPRSQMQPIDSESALCARPGCGKPFRRIRRQQYCSDACRQAAHREGRKSG